MKSDPTTRTRSRDSSAAAFASIDTRSVRKKLRPTPAPPPVPNCGSKRMPGVNDSLCPVRRAPSASIRKSILRCAISGAAASRMRSAMVSLYIAVTTEQEACARVRRRNPRLSRPRLQPGRGTSMSKRFLTLLMLAAAPLLAQQPQQNSQTFGEKVDVNLVQLDAIVTDSRGNQMLGLGKDDFIVRENGQPQTVDTVDYFTNRRLIDTPEALAKFKVERVHDDRYLIFFFDKVTSDAGSQGEMIRARSDAMRFLDDHLRAEDRVAVVGHDVRLKVYTDFTSDKAQIRRALNDATAYGLGIRSKDAAGTGPSLMRNMDIDRMISHTGSVYEALDLLGDALRPIRARKDVVLFSNGIVGPDEEVRGGAVLNRSRYYDPMIESLNSADVTLYPISLQSGIDVPEYVHQNLASMAADTNGQYFRLHTSYLTPLSQIEKKTAGYYLISYYTKKRPGEHGFQKVDVALRNPEFKVSARSGYSYGD